MKQNMKIKNRITENQKGYNYITIYRYYIYNCYIYCLEAIRIIFELLVNVLHTYNRGRDIEGG